MGRKYSAPAVGKLFDIVDLLSAEDRGYSINEIARLLGIPINTVYRICIEMAQRDYLEKNEADGLYYIGSRFFILGQIVGSRIDLRQKALPIMEELRDSLDETVHLCVRRENRMVLLDQKETKQPIRIHVETGSLLLAHASAFGKCLLAWCREDTLDGILADGLKAMTQNTVIKPDDLKKEIEMVRTKGVAYDHEEYMPSVCCVGAPVHGSTQMGIAAIGVMAPSYRFTPDRMLAVAPIVQNAAKRFSTKMGFIECIDRKKPENACQQGSCEMISTQ